MKLDLSLENIRKVSQGHLKTKWLTRYISIYITKLFLHLKISANQATLIDLLCGIIGLVTLSFGGDFYILLGSFFLVFFVIFDDVDGELARFNKTVSLKSYYLEGLCHPIMHPLKFLFLGLGLSKSLDNQQYLYLGIALMFMCSFEQAVTWRREIILKNQEYEYSRSYEKISNKLDNFFFKKLSFTIKLFCQESGMYIFIFLFAVLDFLLGTRVNFYNYQINFSACLMLMYLIVLIIMVFVNVLNSFKIIDEFENKKK